MIRILLLSIFLPSVLFGQDMSNSIGIVTFTDVQSDELKIDFLNEDGSVWWTLDFYANSFPFKEDFLIEAFKPDYFLFKVKCINEEEEFYNVVVNNEVGWVKKIAKSPKLKLVTWGEYALNVFSVDFDIQETPIYDTIGGERLTDLPDESKILEPKEIEGEWMRIIWSKTEEYPEEHSNDNRTGWIRWKENDRIIVRLFHLS